MKRLICLFIVALLPMLYVPLKEANGGFNSSVTTAVVTAAAVSSAASSARARDRARADQEKVSTGTSDGAQGFIRCIRVADDGCIIGGAGCASGRAVSWEEFLRIVKGDGYSIVGMQYLSYDKEVIVYYKKKE